MTWIDYVLIGILALVVTGIIVYLVKEKRKGESGCGCGCGGCPHANTCASANCEKPVNKPQGN